MDDYNPNSAKTEITLNPAGVIAPAHKAADACIELMGISLTAIDGAELGDVYRWNKEGLGVVLNFSDDAATRRETHRNRLIAMGFRELGQGIRAMFEEALIFVRCAEAYGGEGVQTTIDAIGEAARAWAREAEQATFPQLFKAVTARLKDPLGFGEDAVTFTKVRNCLEHRYGVVGSRDVDQNGFLRLRYPGVSLALVTATGEVPLVFGTPIEEGGNVVGRFTITEKAFELGQKITFTHEEFVEIAMGVRFLAADLVHRLPSV